MIHITFCAKSDTDHNFQFEGMVFCLTWLCPWLIDDVSGVYTMLFLMIMAG
jgi:hypothetical protein